MIKVDFASADCLACPQRAQCVKPETAPRRLHLRPQAEFELLQQQRHSQLTDTFKQRYNKRAGIEVVEGIPADELARSIPLAGGADDAAICLGYGV